MEQMLENQGAGWVRAHTYLERSSTGLGYVPENGTVLWIVRIPIYKQVKQKPWEEMRKRCMFLEKQIGMLEGALRHLSEALQRIEMQLFIIIIYYIVSFLGQYYLYF